MIKNTLLLLFLVGVLSFPSFSQEYDNEFKVKAGVNLDKPSKTQLDAGFEIHMQSFDPRGFGVFGVDVEDSLPIFNMGYNHKFDDVEVFAFVGFGLKNVIKTRTVNSSSSSSSTSSAVSSNGCQNGQGEGVQNQCNGQTNGNGNGNGGSSSNNSSNGNTSTTTTTTTNSSSTVTYEDEDVVQEFGIRVSPRLDDSPLAPYIELNTSTTNAGFDYDEKVKIGLIYTF